MKFIVHISAQNISGNVCIFVYVIIFNMSVYVCLCTCHVTLKTHVEARGKHVAPDSSSASETGSLVIHHST